MVGVWMCNVYVCILLHDIMSSISFPFVSLAYLSIRMKSKSTVTDSHKRIAHTKYCCCFPFNIQPQVHMLIVIGWAVSQTPVDVYSNEQYQTEKWRGGRGLPSEKEKPEKAKKKKLRCPRRRCTRYLRSNIATHQSFSLIGCWLLLFDSHPIQWTNYYLFVWYGISPKKIQR